MRGDDPGAAELRRRLEAAERASTPAELHGAWLLLGLLIADPRRQARVRRWLVGGLLLGRGLVLAIMTGVTVWAANLALTQPTSFNLAMLAFVAAIEVVLLVVVLREIVTTWSRRR